MMQVTVLIAVALVGTGTLGCTSPGPSGGGLTEAEREWIQSRLVMLRAEVAPEPSCGFGFTFNSSRDTINFVSPSEYRDGLRPGDQLYRVDGEPYSVSETSRYPVGHLFRIEVFRHGRVETHAVRCSDMRRAALEMLGIMEALEREKWVECQSKAHFSESVVGRAAPLASIQEFCSRKHYVEYGLPPDLRYAIVKHEAMRRQIRDARFETEGVVAIVSAYLADVSWLEENGYASLARDLRDRYEKALVEPR